MPGKLDLGGKWASRIGKAWRKQLGMRPGLAERILQLRGNMGGPSSCWEHGGKAGSLRRDAPGSRETEGADELGWVAVGRGSRGWDAGNSGV